MEGGWYRIVVEQDGKVLSLKGNNLMPVDLVPVRVDNVTVTSQPQPSKSQVLPEPT